MNFAKRLFSILMKFINFVVLMAALLALSSCGSLPSLTTATGTASRPTIPAASPEPTFTPQPSLTPSLAPVIPTATTAPEPLRTQYELKADLDYLRHFLTVRETIDYSNHTGQVLTEMVLAVEPNRYPGGFRLNQLKAGETIINNFTLENNQLKFTLPAALEMNQLVQLSITYDLSLPFLPRPTGSINSGIYGYSARQMNLVDWYPYIPPYSKDHGWAMHNPWFYGEHQVYEMADFQVDLTLGAQPANLTIAAASQAKIEDRRYSYTHRNARNFTFSVSDMYVVYARVAGQVTVTSYVFPFDANAGLTALNDAIQALNVYNQYFGAYPHDSLSVVEVDFQDGMEYDGLYFLSKGFYNTFDGTPKGYLTMIGVHETAHQWWYARVANDEALEPWLDEALATYSELLFYSKVHPGYEDWWWSYRVDFFEPKGWVNLRIYDYTGSYPYRDGVYLRGARFLHAVRTRIGDQTFFDFLKDYAAREQNQIATSQDFFSILKQHTSADISDLVKEYFKP